MYLPSRFKIQDEEEVLALVHANPLATVITVVDGAPFVSHLPLLLEKRGSDLALVGHLACANPHAAILRGSQSVDGSAPDRRTAYVIFNGPNAYISPRWYGVDDVPTWNYAVVHMQGEVTPIEDYIGVVECVKKLSAFAERDVAAPWKFWLPPDLADPSRLTKAIVGFEIRVTDVKAKFKLSQNRPQDRDSVVSALRTERDDSRSIGIADLMSRLVRGQ